MMLYYKSDVLSKSRMGDRVTYFIFPALHAYKVIVRRRTIIEKKKKEKKVKELLSYWVKGYMENTIGKFVDIVEFVKEVVGVFSVGG